MYILTLLLIMVGRIDDSLSICVSIRCLIWKRRLAVLPGAPKYLYRVVARGCASWWVITGRKILPVSQRSFPSAPAASYEYTCEFFLALGVLAYLRDARDALPLLRALRHVDPRINARFFSLWKGALNWYRVRAHPTNDRSIAMNDNDRDIRNNSRNVSPCLVQDVSAKLPLHINTAWCN